MVMAVIDIDDRPEQDFFGAPYDFDGSILHPHPMFEDDDYGYTPSQTALSLLEQDGNEGDNLDLGSRLSSPFSFFSFSSSSSGSREYTSVSHSASPLRPVQVGSGSTLWYESRGNTANIRDSNSSCSSTLGLGEQDSAINDLEWLHFDNNQASDETQYDGPSRDQQQVVWEEFRSQQASSVYLSTHLPTETPCASQSSLARSTTGYAGQFALDEYFDVMSRSHYPTAYGNRFHPNGIFTNNPLISGQGLGLRAGHYGNQQQTLQLRSILDFASDKAWEAGSDATAAHRTPEEERLRTEGYRECARARLEGVPVGQYRYFHGHLTLEEYIENGLCVCWEGCLCTGVCTMYSDVICPCNKHLQLKQD